MKFVVAAILGALALCGAFVDAANEIKQPVVNIYTRTPVEYGKENTLICHCSGFHPPRINIALMKGNEKMEGVTLTDLAFDRDWSYFLSAHTTFIPKEGVMYKCEVQHDQGEPKTHNLEIL